MVVVGLEDCVVIVLEGRVSLTCVANVWQVSVDSLVTGAPAMASRCSLSLSLSLSLSHTHTPTHTHTHTGNVRQGTSAGMHVSKET
jgi:hypothetical protein